ncbi:MAG: D-sedoheptulose 7-phosphate isomerase [bacterium]
MNFNFATALDDHSALVSKVKSDLLPNLQRAVDMMVEAMRVGNKALFFGNGGSAADAQHLAAELVGRFARERRGLPALALSVNTSTLTAIGNDYGFDEIFVRQVEAFGHPGDVAVGLTTSGNSPNVVLALVRAKKLGLKTIAFSGRGGGKVAAAADLTLVVPHSSTPRIQEMHIMLGHLLCEAVEATLFPEAK